LSKVRSSPRFGLRVAILHRLTTTRETAAAAPASMRERVAAISQNSTGAARPPAQVRSGVHCALIGGWKSLNRRTDAGATLGTTAAGG
jgi:hypothetical protein